MLPRVVRCQDVSSTWDEAVGWQNGTAPSPPSLSPPWPRQPSLCPAPCRRRAGKAESGATVARWCLWQAGSGPVCAAHVLDTGLRGCLHDALLVWSEPGAGAALPQFPHREGCSAVRAGPGRGGGSGWGRDQALVLRGQLRWGRMPGHTHTHWAGRGPAFWGVGTCLLTPSACLALASLAAPATPSSPASRWRSAWAASLAWSCLPTTKSIL